MPLGFRDFDAFGRWYSYRRLRETGRQASPTTVRTKQVHIARICNLLGIEQEESLGEALCDRQQVEFVLDSLAAQVTPGAMRVSVYALLDYGAYAASQGLCGGREPALTKADIPPKNPDPRISVYTPEEMEAFVSAARGVDVRWWALMAYLVDTGRRIGETLNLQWAWFRLDLQPPYVEVPDTKNGDPQYVPLSRRLSRQVFTPENIQRMKEMPLRTGSAPHRGDPRLMPFPWTYNVARARFARFAERTGLPDKGFHCFRHSVITDRIARGVPLTAVSQLAGHRSIQTTERRYNHTNALSFSQFVEREPEEDLVSALQH